MFRVSFNYSSVQLLSSVWLFATPWTAACQASLSITNTQSLPKLMSTEMVMPFKQLILFRPLLLPSIFLIIRIFSDESVLYIMWPKYWSFSFNISPSNEHPGRISFRMDWLDLFAVQGTLKSLLQHHRERVRHYWQNGGTVPSPLSSFCSHGSRNEGVRPCHSDLSFPLLGWVDWKGILRCLLFLRGAWEGTKPSAALLRK